MENWRHERNVSSQGKRVVARILGIVVAMMTTKVARLFRENKRGKMKTL
jgi:hypothetical protein